jgi:CheY-like chemotaxis protein
VATESETGADAALDRPGTERFDCVVSDYEMAGMDGTELFERLRDRGDDPVHPVHRGR